MPRSLMKYFSILAAITLAGCSGNMTHIYPFSPQSDVKVSQVGEGKGMVGTAIDQSGEEQKVKVTMTGGGEIGLRSMDANDKSKMSRALDAAPGKSTTWTNTASGIQYTVTPKRKIVVNQNPFCREYEVVAGKGEYKRSITEKACVMSDGGWHTI